TDGVTLWVDDLRCEVRHVGTPAHTTNDSIVWIPERRVLFSGDLLFNGGTPFLLQGSVSGVIKALEEVIAPLDAETIVPGHGPVGGPELIDRAVAYALFVQTTAAAGKEAGLTPLEVAREADLGPFAELTDAERLVGNLHRAYAELDGLEPGGQIDVVAAINDMIAFNGGRPLTCRAWAGPAPRKMPCRPGPPGCSVLGHERGTGTSGKRRHRRSHPASPVQRGDDGAGRDRAPH